MPAVIGKQCSLLSCFIKGKSVLVWDKLVVFSVNYQNRSFVWANHWKIVKWIRRNKTGNKVFWRHWLDIDKRWLKDKHCRRPLRCQSAYSASADWASEKDNFWRVHILACNQHVIGRNKSFGNAALRGRSFWSSITGIFNKQYPDSELSEPV